jgi:hypothetical protein
MPELRGRGEQLCPLLAIAAAGATCELQHREGEHCLAIAALDRQPIPFGCFLVVALDAEPLA